MTTRIEAMREEFRKEAAVTRRVLERVPEDRLPWKPHAKSMSLGQLAMHIASVPGGIVQITQAEWFDASQANFVPPSPKTAGEILTTLEQSVREVEACLQGMTEEGGERAWHMMLGDKELFCTPRIEVLRSIMLNHWYHHRGQLSVYLRLLDLPVPSIYGPSADESPFS